ncbi:MAG: demethoxyubiquinone hydroxylase family protein [Burkholderiales bacterium PBB1]|nr:MAG: demethoxyubiquinone hydroxylase family protein [Burkholderiales bacterium PBB1]
MKDAFIAAADHALRTLSGGLSAGRPTPASSVSPVACAELSAAEKALSGALMRVNHVGEVCAQALYQGQALAATDRVMQQRFLDAAREETDHLAWTQQRLDELGAHASLLNPLWYAGSFAIGWLAGRAGDAISLGFVVETERQVEQHLDEHLGRLPAGDQRSRAIVHQMKADEARHANDALQAGATPLPAPIRWGMRAVAKVMTTTAHHL